MTRTAFTTSQYRWISRPARARQPTRPSVTPATGCTSGCSLPASVPRSLGRVGGTAGVDNAFAQQHEPGIGAEIMGAGKFVPPGWQDDADWKEWWGPNPRFTRRPSC